MHGRQGRLALPPTEATGWPICVVMLANRLGMGLVSEPRKDVG